MGRMAEPEEIHAFCEALLEKREHSFASGPRHRGRHANRSTTCASSAIAPRGGWVSLAEEARRRGADVTLVASNLTVARPAGVEVVDAPTAADLEREVLARADADLVLMAAAVADYRPLISVSGKRGKDASTWTVELEPTTDVLRKLGEGDRRGILVGFAAESGCGRDRARARASSPTRT